jgi:uncharacterized membrane protein YcfT
MNNNTGKIYNWISKAFNLPALKKSRLHWVDYLKGIAIILVVYRHSLLGIERSGAYVPHYLVNANMIFYSFRMPLFFILSGIFVSRRWQKKLYNNSSLQNSKRLFILILSGFLYKSPSR